jgi:hypothetical protein
MAFKQFTDKPAGHPKLETGYTREIVLEVSAETEKAFLIMFEDKLQSWVPKSVCKLRLPYLKPISLVDGKTVVDIEDWWYDKNIRK